MSEKTKEIFRFLITGCIATAIDFFVMSMFIYITCNELFLDFIDVFLHGKQLAPTHIVVIGTGLGFIISLIFNYILSCIFVFKNGKSAQNKKGFVLFTLLSTIGLGIHLLGMFIGYDVFGINEWIIKIILTFIVLIFNYITRKKFIFKEVEHE